MKTRSLAFFGMSVLLANSSAFADLDPATISIAKVPQVAAPASDSPDQLLTLQFQQFQPKAVQVDNGSYNFNYGNQISSFLGEAGWAGKLLDFHGAFYFEENLAFSTFSGNVSSSSTAQPGSSSYSLYLLGLDTRLMYAADWFPVKWLIPFGDAGYQYSVYYQPSSSGSESVEGGVGNFVAGGGVRIWVNRHASLNSGNSPIYLSAKYNKIFSSGGSLDLASASFLGGLSLGF
jgi:hypothetical protein